MKPDYFVSVVILVLAPSAFVFSYHPTLPYTVLSFAVTFCRCLSIHKPSMPTANSNSSKALALWCRRLLTTPSAHSSTALSSLLFLLAAVVLSHRTS